VSIRSRSAEEKNYRKAARAEGLTDAGKMKVAKKLH